MMWCQYASTLCSCSNLDNELLVNFLNVKNLGVDKIYEFEKLNDEENKF